MIKRGIKLANSKKLYLKEGREKPVKKKHPWIFSGAIKKVAGDPFSGETVQVLDASGDFWHGGHIVLNPRSGSESGVGRKNRRSPLIISAD